MRNSRSVLSLFSGAGGLDLGLEMAGWTVIGQIEMDEDSAQTLRLTAERTGGDPLIIEDRVENVDPAELRGELGLEPGDLGMISAGPPCQPFTTTGLRQAINDRRAESAFPSLLTYIEEFQPSTLVIENVDGLLSAALSHRPLKKRGPGNPPLSWEEKKGSFLYWLLGELGDLGYSVGWGVLEAADHGAPQMRQRAFLLGVMDKRPCYLPDPSYGRKGLPPYRTLRDALEGLDAVGAVQPLSDRKTAVFEKIPAGGNWRDLPEEQQEETMGAAYHATGGKSGWWRRLSWGDPSPTILGMPDHSSTALIHPDEVRCLSVNECALVQTFPQEMQFSGNPRSQYQQIGNAVPPLVGKAVGQAVAEHLDGVLRRQPDPPKWRKASANRRIGTHGWVVCKEDRLRYHVIAKIRDDHIWAEENYTFEFA